MEAQVPPSQPWSKMLFREVIKLISCWLSYCVVQC